MTADTTPAPPPVLELCAICNDMDYICKHCRRPDGDCTCDGGPDLIKCPEGPHHNG